ncbi:MAG TPA: hypothetical protein PKE36_00630 [Chiayiivirga sp.]|nr:hypothetical protein [Chiayiivirga sp.]
MKKLVVSGMALMLAACGAPRIDTSSEDALQSSIQQIRQSLSGADQDEFDELIALARKESSRPDVVTGRLIPMTELLQPVNGMTGTKMLAFVRKQDAEAKELARLRGDDVLDELQALNQSVVISEPVFDGGNLHAKVTNNRDVALSWVDFVYDVRTPGRTLPWQQGDAAFLLDGGLEPGETRVLSAVKLGLRHRFTDISKASAALEEHPDARATLLVVDVKGPDKMTLVEHFALFPSDEVLEQLRQRLAEK